MPLETGTTYYSNIRAITGAGNVLDSTSNGFVVDRTAPSLTILTMGDSQLNQSNPTSSVIYQKDSNMLVASWDATEPESEVVSMAVTIGTSPGRLITPCVTDINIHVHSVLSCPMCDISTI